MELNLCPAGSSQPKLRFFGSWIKSSIQWSWASESEMLWDSSCSRRVSILLIPLLPILPDTLRKSPHMSLHFGNIGCFYYDSPVDPWFAAPVLKNYATCSVLVILWCIESKKNWLNLCSTCLGCARSRCIWVWYGGLGKKSEKVINMLKNRKKKCFGQQRVFLM